MNELEAPADYRQSHLAKGQDYDAYIARDPWSHYMARLEERLLTDLVARLFPEGLPSALDFACGTGRITRVLERLARRTWAVDVSETMVAEARRKCPRTTFVVQDLTTRDLPIEPVSLATAFRFFGNAEDALREAALAAIRRHLRPGGHLVINNHRNPGALQERLNRLTGGTATLDLDHAKLRRLLRRSGFEIEHARGIGLWLVHHRTLRATVLESRLARVLEPLSRLALAAPLCPDAVIVARKTG